MLFSKNVETISQDEFKAWLCYIRKFKPKKFTLKERMLLRF